MKRILSARSVRAYLAGIDKAMAKNEAKARELAEEWDNLAELRQVLTRQLPGVKDVPDLRSDVPVMPSPPQSMGTGDDLKAPPTTWVTAPLAQAQQGNVDLFGIPPSEQASGDLAQAKFWRRRKFMFPSCSQNPAPHVHERQLDGSMVCQAPQIGTVGEVVEGMQAQKSLVTGQGEQVSDGYAITFEDVNGCYWANGSHCHQVKGDEVTCLAPEEQWKIPTPFAPSSPH